MAIAQVCVKCGWDLARVRPEPEPHYGLKIIRCGRCAAVSTRQLHPVSDGWRKFRRLDFVMTVIGVRVGIIVTLTFLSTMACVGGVALWSEIQESDGLPRGAGLFLIAVFAVLAPLLGAFLTSAFEHIPLWKVWLGWLGWMALILFMVSLHGPIDPQFDPRNDIQQPGDTLWRWVGQGVLFITLPSMLVALAIAFAALAGVPLGRGLLWLSAVGRRARWRRRYRRRRLARAAVV